MAALLRAHELITKRAEDRLLDLSATRLIDGMHDVREQLASSAMSADRASPLSRAPGRSAPPKGRTCGLRGARPGGVRRTNVGR